MKCPSCGQEIANDSVFCGFCGYRIPQEEQVQTKAVESSIKEKPKGSKVLPIVLAVAVVALGALCAYFGTQVSAKNNEISQLNNLVTELNESIEKKDANIKKLQTERDDAKKKAGYYSQVVQGVKSGNNGRGADHFKVNYPVVYLNKGETKKVKLTAHWASGGTVSYSSDVYGVAALDYGDDEWTESTNLEITGKKEGVVVYTFTNNKDKYKFKMIVIVE